MNPQERKWAYVLLHVINQYAESRFVQRNYAGQLVAFEHQCMSAGEEAADVLAAAGLGHDQGWQFELNEAAIELMRGELSE